MSRVKKLVEQYRKLSSEEKGAFLREINIAMPVVEEVEGAPPDPLETPLEKPKLGTVEDCHKFYLYHQRPQWLEEGAPTPGGDNLFITQLISDDCLSVHIAIDRGGVIELLEKIMLVDAYLSLYNKTASGLALPGEIVRCAELHRGPDFDVIRERDIVVFGAGTDKAQVWTLKEFEKEFIEKQPDNWKDCRQAIRERAIRLDSLFCTGVVSKLNFALGQLASDASLALDSEDLDVSAEDYKILTFDPTLIVGLRGPGGKTRRPGYDWQDEEKHRQFQERVRQLRPLWDEAIRLMGKLDYDSQCLGMLKGNTDLQALSSDLLKEALINRKRLRENGNSIPLKLGPYAYALKQAARELDVTNPFGMEYEFNTLKKYHEGSLPQQKMSRDSDR